MIMIRDQKLNLKEMGRIPRLSINVVISHTDLKIKPILHTWKEKEQILFLAADMPAA